jgi:hypothetical protein
MANRIVRVHGFELVIFLYTYSNAERLHGSVDGDGADGRRRRDDGRSAGACCAFQQLRHVAGPVPAAESERDEPARVAANVQRWRSRIRAARRRFAALCTLRLTD